MHSGCVCTENTARTTQKETSSSVVSVQDTSLHVADQVSQGSHFRPALNQPDYFSGV